MNLDFDNLGILTSDLSTTVRRGTKWLGTTGRVPVTEKGWPTPFDALVYRTEMMSYEDVSEDIILHEHDPDCRTREGLDQALQKAYGALVPEELVTVIWFWVRRRV